jgi:hypothetical protein
MSALSMRLRRCGESHGRVGEFEWRLLVDAADEIDQLEAADPVKAEQKPSNAGWQGAR